MIWRDELETVGSKTIVGPGLRELAALGFLTESSDQEIRVHAGG